MNADYTITNIPLLPVAKKAHLQKWSRTYFADHLRELGFVSWRGEDLSWYKLVGGEVLLTIYLFDSTYTVYEQRLDSKEQRELGTVPMADEIVFDWQDEYLIIRSKNHAGADTYEVKVIKIEN